MMVISGLLVKASHATWITDRMVRANQPSRITSIQASGPRIGIEKVVMHSSLFLATHSPIPFERPWGSRARRRENSNQLACLVERALLRHLLVPHTLDRMLVPRQRCEPAI